VALILIGQSVAGALLLWLISAWVFPFTFDSIMYITTAEHIVHGKGLLCANLFVDPPLPDVLPMSLTPPGFPISIAILKWLGLNAYFAALSLPRICFLFLPFLFFKIFKRFFPDNVSLIASGMCSLTSTVLTCSVIAWSDTPYLVLSLLVFLMVFNIIEKKTSVHWSYIVLTGILSGFAFLFRYVGISLMASIGICLIVATIIRMITFKDLVRTGLLYGLGLCLPVVPYCIRNLVIFGVIGKVPPSISTALFLSHLHIVVQLYLQGLSLIIFGISPLSWVIFILVICFFCWFLGRMKGLMMESHTKFISLVLIYSYFFIYSFFLIYNKSDNFLSGNPDIDQRVMMQLSWALLGGIIFVIYAGIKRWVPSKGDIKVLTWFLILIFVVIQIFPLINFYQKQSEIKVLSKKIGQYSFSRLPPDDVIVSNLPEITYYFTQRNVRALANYTPFGLLYYLGGQRKFVVFLVKNCGHLSPAWKYPDEWKKPDWYKNVYSDGTVDLLVPSEAILVKPVPKVK